MKIELNNKQIEILIEILEEKQDFYRYNDIIELMQEEYINIRIAAIKEILGKLGR